MKKIIGGKLHLSRKYLVEQVGISINTIRDWPKGQSRSLSPIGADGDTWYQYDTIPAQSLKKVEEFEATADLVLLAEGYHGNYARFLPQLVKAGVKPSKREELARSWAVWHRIASLADKENPERISLSQAFELYTRLRLPRQITNYYSFSRKLSEFRADPLAAMVNGKTGRQGNAKKLTPIHCQLIEKYYAMPNKFKAPAILDQVNADLTDLGLKTIEVRTVRNYIRLPEVESRNHLSRNGEKAFSDEQKAYIGFNRPGHVADRAEMDGLKMPFWCHSKDGGKLIRPNLFAIIDAHSGKITGWSLDETETRYNIIQALRSQASAGYFPALVWTDNFSPKRTAELKDVIRKIEERGTQIKYCGVGNSQGKPYIERFFGTLQDRFCREYPDFLGMDIKSRSKANRPNPDALKRHHKEHGYPTFEQMRERVQAMLDKYHETSFGGKPTPNERYAASERPNARPVSEGEIPYLFWHRTVGKVNRGFLTIQVNNQQYTFRAGVAHNGQTLSIRYDPAELSEVYAFTNDEAETHLGVFPQELGIDRNDLKSIGDRDRRNRKERKEQEQKALALLAPHRVPKEVAQNAEDEYLAEQYGTPADSGGKTNNPSLMKHWQAKAEEEAEEDEMNLGRPTHRSPVAVRPSLKVYQPVEEEDD